MTAVEDPAAAPEPEIVPMAKPQGKGRTAPRKGDKGD